MSKGGPPEVPGRDRLAYGPAGPALGPFGPNFGPEPPFVVLFDIFLVWACFDQRGQVFLQWAPILIPG